MSKFDCCAHNQYCDLCVQEWEAEEKDFEALPAPSRKSQEFEIISEDRLFYNGRSFQIVGINEEATNTRYYTAEGFAFYVRESGQKIVLVKIMRFKKNGKKPVPPKEEIFDLLKGPIPAGLTQDQNW